MKIQKNGLFACALLAVVALYFNTITTTPVLAANCPAITLSDTEGLSGKHMQQFERSEFEGAVNCMLSFAGNPDIAGLNAKIIGNPDLPPVAKRLPEEPLVVVPNKDIGRYGGVLRVLSNATEAGTSGNLSLRHVNMVRIADDLQTIVPNIATGWTWNDNFTELTFTLRKGHRWSDGQPFTAEDVSFWFNDVIQNREIFPKPQSRWVFAGKTMRVEVIDSLNVKFVFPVPLPSIMNRFAVGYIQPFLPKHFFSKYHIKYNPNANKLAKEKGYENWTELFNVYYGGTDWKDAPSPLLKGADTRVMPTLESYILVEETTIGRRLVANPYFHMVDTAGQQLPYINEILERYVPEAEARNLKIINDEVDYKLQSLKLKDFPLFKENEARGGYNVHLTPALDKAVYYAFNTTYKDDVLRAVFNDVRFRQAMSLAINRDEILELVYLGQGAAMQATPGEPGTVAFQTDAHTKAFVEFDPAKSKALLGEMGLKDSDGDGVRELPDGRPFVIQMLFANQGGPVKCHELVQSYWADVGVKVNTREVSTDEYRTKGGANELAVTTWLNAQRAGVTISQSTTLISPPFGNEWQPGTGFEWVTWKNSGGKQGMEPPEDAKRLWELAEKFNLVLLGSDESNALGKKIADIHARNLWKIGIVGDSGTPVIISKRIGNFKPYKKASDSYYFAVPFRPQQWFYR